MNSSICQDKSIIIRRCLLSNSLRLSCNARHQIILSAPLFCPQSILDSFLKKHTDWIQTHQKQRLAFKVGQHISLLGQSLTITQNPVHTATYIQGDKLMVSGDPEFIERRIINFIKKETLLYISQEAHQKAGKINKTIHKITLKDTISRWGSCSSKHNLNFCWRLGLAPLFVLDYLIAHEVAHLQEMNHSSRFWEIVAHLTSHRADAEIWLRRHGHTLR